ncbi:MAG: F0F1 ATP synthase subunit A [Cyanobacteria bacterium REEB65]|nr:F0F1 ATP synthase subunit A [Cyanobacteria bacterium REEB65]
MAAQDAGVKVGEHVFGILQNGFSLPDGFTAQTLDEFGDRHPMLAHLHPWQIVHVDTVVYTWLVMALLLGVGFLASRGLSRVPSGGQTVSEMVVEFAQGIVRSFIGPEVVPYLWFIGSLFVFILIANWLGTLPWQAIGALGWPRYEPPTSDINTTAGFALLSFLTYFAFGFAHKGLGYFKHYVTPKWFMLPFLIVEDISRPLSLALRLFANITSGHVIITVLLLLLPFFVPAPLMGFEIFVGAIQAFIFAALSATYIGAAVSSEH